MGEVLTFFSTPKQAHAASSSLPYNATANGPYTVKGNTIVGANGKQYIFHGIGRDGLEYNCSGEGPLDQQHLAYMGSGTNTATETYWGANTVRLPLSEGFWLNGAPGYPCTATQYQALVKQTVDNLTALKLNVIIDLQWTDAGGQSGQGGGAWAMPDADSVLFWQQIAPIYKTYSNVLFELYNEPHPGGGWSCWAVACTITNDSGSSEDCQCTKTLTYQSVGMQALVNAVRNAGANNLVLVAGRSWGYDLTEVGTIAITGGNVVYDTHPYPYAGKLAADWDSSFGNISLKYPVISAESGQYDCKSDYVSQLYDYFDAHQISWVAWAWVANGDPCGYPQAVTDYQGTPSTSMGQYIYQRLHSYAYPYNNIGTSDDANPGSASYDSVGYSYSAQALQVAGITPNNPVTFNNATFIWPSSPSGVANNHIAQGQILPVTPVNGAQTLAFLGSATNGNTSGTATITYTDGSTQNFTLGMSDWTLGGGKASTAFGNAVVASMPYRNGVSGKQNIQSFIFYAGVPLLSGKTISSVTLPSTVTGGLLHIFAVGTSTSAFSSAYNNTGASDDTNTSLANYDYGGYSYSAQALHAAGITPGNTVTFNNATFTWPGALSGVANNYIVQGQIVPVTPVNGAQTLAFLGSATNGNTSGTATITYTDGSTQTFTLGMSDWTLGGGKSFNSLRKCCCGKYVLPQWGQR